MDDKRDEASPSPLNGELGRVFAVEFGVERERVITFFGTSSAHFFILPGWENENDVNSPRTNSTFCNRPRSGC
jgi:hypothetical protein